MNAFKPSPKRAPASAKSSEAKSEPHKWAKLIRFVPGAEIDQLLASYDPVKNLLRINQELYALLPEKDQLMLWRAKENIELTYRDDDRK